MAGKITEFEDLTVWQATQSLAVEIYKLTKTFPKEELFAMTSQLRRASSSTSANIAEGCGRSSTKNKLHFYTMVYGSLLEVKNFLYLAVKLGYMMQDDLKPLLADIVSCQKLLNTFRSGMSRA